MLVRLLLDFCSVFRVDLLAVDGVSMDRSRVARLTSLVAVVSLAPVVVVGVLGTWTVLGAAFTTTTRSTGLSGGNGLIGIPCVLVALVLATIGFLRTRNPADPVLDGAFRRGLIFGGVAGAVACGVRMLIASDLTISSAGRSYGLSSHPGWGVELTTACFVVYAAAGLADSYIGRAQPVSPASEGAASVVAAVPAADLVSLLQTAFIHGDEASLEALVAAGPECVSRFRDVLSGELRLDLPPDRVRTLIDNATAVSCKIAATYPAKYVASFADVDWMRHSEVLAGLGYTQRPEAVPVLVTALSSELPGVTRLSAAIALRYFPGPEPIRALTAVLNDPDDLVRSHAQASLVALGVSPSA
jgi:hypothetical protein